MRNIKLEEERRKIEEDISELMLQISKLDNVPDKDGKLSWIRDDEIEALNKEFEKKLARIKAIDESLKKEFFRFCKEPIG